MGTAGNFGPYENTATASATTPDGSTVDDDSQDGTNPDLTDGAGGPPDGDPTNDDGPTPVTFVPASSINLLKEQAIVPGPSANPSDCATATLLQGCFFCIGTRSFPLDYGGNLNCGLIMSIMTSKVVIPGGRGFLGSSLANYLVTKGYEVIILTRKPRRTQGPIQDVFWDGKTLEEWAQTFEGATAVVNLTGRSVNCLPTAKNKREIIESRVDSVNVVAQAISQANTPPNVLVQASSLAIYGDTQETCTEESAHGQGFATRVCESWEGTLEQTNLPNTRKVVLRIGFVLGSGGGALGPLANLTKRFLGGQIASGQQYISWLHIEDLNRMILWAIESDKVQGAFNATNPNPVTNAEFMQTLRLVLNRPWSPPIPAWAVRIGAVFMRTDASLALTGRKCVPERAQAMGFNFHYLDLQKALHNITSLNY